MPVNLVIEKSGTGVRFKGTPVRINERTHKGADNTVQIAIVCSDDIAQLPGGKVKLEFHPPEARNMFVNPPPLSFDVQAGRSVVLTFKNNLGISRRPAAGPGSTPSPGVVDPAFTAVAGFNTPDVARVGGDHNDLHYEC